MINRKDDKIIGMIDKIFFVNKDFMIARFKLQDLKRKYINVSGKISSMSPGFLYQIEGSWTKTSKPTFNIIKFSLATLEIDEREYWISQISSTQFPSITKKNATLIVDYYKDNICEKILANKEELRNIEGLIGPKIEIIYDGMKRIKYTNKWSLFFREHGFDQKILLQVITLYKSNLEDIDSVFEEKFLEIARDKYLSPSFIEILSIEYKINEINNKLEEYIFSQRRIAFIIWNIINKMIIKSQSTFIYYNEFLKMLQSEFNNYNFNNILWVNFKSLISGAINYGLENNLIVPKICIKTGKKILYSYESFTEEQTIAKTVVDLYNSKPLKTKISFNKGLEIFLEKVKFMENNFIINKEVKDILKLYYDSNLVIISGEPGTGKTSIIELLFIWHKIIIDDIFSNNILTPTGRAASRIGEILKKNIEFADYINPTTIHSYLGFDGEKIDMTLKQKISGDILIVDECSMISSKLFSFLFSTVNTDKKLVLIGDINQLPSIDYGNVFEDLCNSFKDNFIILKNNYRSAKKIIELSRLINNDKIDEFDFKNSEQIEFIELYNTLDPLEPIKDVYKKILESEKLHKLSPIDKVKREIKLVQVISPVNKNQYGVETLNLSIQNISNPHGTYISKGRSIQYKYREYDKVMCLINKKEFGISNGDMGLIINDPETSTTYCEFNNDSKKELDKFATDELTLGYACTIHKVQGSEYDNVLLVVDDTFKNNYNFLNKKMIYTALTRAKKKIYIFTNIESFKEICRNKPDKRMTKLAEKIAKYLNNK
ncbi:ATP-dependent DNA helicase [Spiroplasma endosymbiont of Aspidapion aeneum]|uniref:ATP-dependent DNA helicase n=1 Tax=Spiroplasma endosymbiont of Aspidapion aeneum TaxID=3066276 RepID=UPI00313E2668